MNKYNVRAIRKELDDCVRNHSWKKFRTTLTTLRSKPELLQAVISTKHSKLSSGSLLHALVKLSNVPLDLVTDIATGVPSILSTTDSSQQTPLHIAIERQTVPEMIGTFLELNTACLHMTDKQGDTPLLKAARGDRDIALLKLLLQKDPSRTSALLESKRKQRTPLWYVASNDLQLIHSGYEELPENLRLMLLETYFALQRKGGSSEDDERDWIYYLEEQEWNDSQSSSRRKTQEDLLVHDNNEQRIALILKAFVACIDLLGKYAIKILEFFLKREMYANYITRQPISNYGDFLLHQLCAQPITRQDAAATHSLLLEQLLRHLQQYTPALVVSRPNNQGNLPLHLALRANKESFVHQLVPLFPEALQHVNDAGELPLHIAIKRRQSENNNNDNDDNSQCWSLAMELWNKYPTATEVVDGKTRLYPFQLVALIAAKKKQIDDPRPSTIASHHNDSDSGGDDSEKKMIISTSFIYELLLAAPQVLARN